MYYMQCHNVIAIIISSTSPLHICPIVFSIRPHDCGTHFLRLVDVRLQWVHFELV